MRQQHKFKKKTAQQQLEINTLQLLVNRNMYMFFVSHQACGWPKYVWVRYICIRILLFSLTSWGKEQQRELSSLYLIVHQHIDNLQKHPPVYAKYGCIRA